MLLQLLLETPHFKIHEQSYYFVPMNKLSCCIVSKIDIRSLRMAELLWNMNASQRRNRVEWSELKMYPTRFFGDSSLKIERQLTSQDPLAKESIGLLKSQANLLSAHKSSGEMRCTSVHLLKSESHLKLPF